jgi:uncharacterized membrane protein YphA (DoxX/SURF4 family)
MTTTALVSELVLAAVLLRAGSAKARSLRRFTRSVTAVARLAGVRLRPRTASALAAVVVGLELATGAVLASGAAPAVGAAGALALTAAFAAVSALALVKGRRVECNCFGRSGATLGTDTLLRALLLLVPATLVAVAAAKGVTEPWPRDGREWVASLALALGALLLFAWASQALALARLVRDRRAAPEPREPRVAGHRSLQELRTV